MSILKKLDNYDGTFYNANVHVPIHNTYLSQVEEIMKATGQTLEQVVTSVFIDGLLLLKRRFNSEE